MANTEKLGKSFYTIIPDGINDLVMDFFIIPKSLKFFGSGEDTLTILEIVEGVSESLWPEIKLKTFSAGESVGCLFMGNQSVKFKIPIASCVFTIPANVRITFER
jgi:hypothetical protein